MEPALWPEARGRSARLRRAARAVGDPPELHAAAAAAALPDQAQGACTSLLLSAFEACRSGTPVACASCTAPAESCVPHAGACGSVRARAGACRCVVAVRARAGAWSLRPQGAVLQDFAFNSGTLEELAERQGREAERWQKIVLDKMLDEEELVEQRWPFKSTRGKARAPLLHRLCKHTHSSALHGWPHPPVSDTLAPALFPACPKHIQIRRHLQPVLVGKCTTGCTS